MDASSASPPTDGSNSKRRKTKRACNHCRDAHMPCDSSRPCEKCVQRGLGATCVDAPRKKKKYLADVPLDALQRRTPPQQQYLATDLRPSHTTPAGFAPSGGPGTLDSVFGMPLGGSGAAQSQQRSGSQSSLLPLPHQLQPLHQLKPPLPHLHHGAGSSHAPGASSSHLHHHQNHHSFAHNHHNHHQHIPSQLNPAAPAPSGAPAAAGSGPAGKPRKSNFLSSAADLEYSTLSSILQDNFVHGSHSTSTEATPNSIVSPEVSPQVHPHGSDRAEAGYLGYGSGSGAAGNGANSPMGGAAIGSGLTPSARAGAPDDYAVSPYSGTNATTAATTAANSVTGNGKTDENGQHLSQHLQQSQSQSQQQQQQQGAPHRKFQYSGAIDSAIKCDVSINQYLLGPVDPTQSHIQNFPDVITAIEEMRKTDPAAYHERNSKSKLSFAVGVIDDGRADSAPGGGAGGSANGANPPVSANLTFTQPEQIYAKVTKPYAYTPGYHQLIAYLRKRFPKEMLVKMAESMAAYRPSFIACTNSLKEEDLIFMEQCFQRTLLTYDNFINVSGTPTIVWRRTGEIAYVGDEFCILTGWAREELISKKKTFIVELLDDKSVLEYFQLFSRIAFGDFLGATMTECTLLTPKNNVKIRTGCMWTLKRDVFGIPMMIIGNFLPIVDDHP